jgi:hypothetical protein
MSPGRTSGAFHARGTIRREPPLPPRKWSRRESKRMGRLLRISSGKRAWLREDARGLVGETPDQRCDGLTEFSHSVRSGWSAMPSRFRSCAANRAHGRSLRFHPLVSLGTTGSTRTRRHDCGICGSRPAGSGVAPVSRSHSSYWKAPASRRRRCDARAFAGRTGVTARPAGHPHGRAALAGPIDNRPQVANLPHKIVADCEGLQRCVYRMVAWRQEAGQEPAAG